MTQNSNEATTDAFQVVFGKEKSGRVRCFGRSITPTALKRQEEIEALKREHHNEVVSLKSEVQEMKVLLRAILLQQSNNNGLNLEALLGILKMSLDDANSAPNGNVRSSASTHIPTNEQVLLL